MVFVGAFVIWQEPSFATWTLAHPAVHGGLLLLLGFFAMLFWWHIVGTGPRLHPEFAPWLAVIMLVLTEIFNMSIAMTRQYNVMTAWIVVTVVSNSATSALIETFMTD